MRFATLSFCIWICNDQSRRKQDIINKCKTFNSFKLTLLQEGVFLIQQDKEKLVHLFRLEPHDCCVRLEDQRKPEMKKLIIIHQTRHFTFNLHLHFPLNSRLVHKCLDLLDIQSLLKHTSCSSQELGRVCRIVELKQLLVAPQLLQHMF
jgi:hypothetical protein